MIERLEVTPGPGTVIRYGSVAAWAASSASSGLVSFLAVSARNLSGSATGGRQLTDHLVGVLGSRDPEPHVPFAVVGPTEDGWAALLHGPVQIWDGTRWITPNPSPGWLRCSVWPQPSLAVSFAGASAPPVSPDALWDLEAGVVPGSGFVLLPAVRTPTRMVGTVGRQSSGQAFTSGEEAELTGQAPAVTGSAPGVTGDEPATLEEDSRGDRPVAPDATAQAPAPTGAGDPLDPVPSSTTGQEAAVATGGSTPTDLSSISGPPGGALDLRSVETRSRLVAYPPLPSGQVGVRPVPGSPVVAGVVCRQGHLNRPGMSACVRCGSSITDQDAYNVSGTRPALGCLVLDDGSVYRLDTGYLVGSDPGRDPTVRGGLARPLTLTGTQLSPSHAEIRLHGWDVMVTDRDSEGGTYLYGPESTAWERLRTYEPRALLPGTHVAFGQRVVTFLTPWITASGAEGRENDEPSQPAGSAAPGGGATASGAHPTDSGPIGSSHETRLRY